MPPTSEQVAENVQRIADAMLDDATRAALAVMDSAKLRIAHNERIVLLAGSVAGLTFTGDIGLSSRSGFHLSAEQLRPLFGAWRLLIFAVLCGLAANSRESLSATLMAAEVERRIRDARLKFMSVEYQHAGMAAPTLAPAPEPGNLRTSMHSAFALWAGRACSYSFALALVLLYRFTSTLFSHL